MATRQGPTPRGWQVRRCRYRTPNSGSVVDRFVSQHSSEAEAVAAMAATTFEAGEWGRVTPVW